MANGDLASLAGFEPVPGTKDIRLGYDDINRLADWVASRPTDSGWSLSPIQLVTGWDTKTDPSGAGSGALSGGIRTVGSWVDLHFRCLRNGGNITGGATGNIVDIPIAKVPALKPASPRYITWAQAGVASGQARIDEFGTIYLTTINNGATIANNAVIQIDATYLIG